MGKESGIDTFINGVILSWYCCSQPLCLPAIGVIWCPCGWSASQCGLIALGIQRTVMHCICQLFREWCLYFMIGLLAIYEFIDWGLREIIHIQLFGACSLIFLDCSVYAKPINMWNCLIHLLAKCCHLWSRTRHFDLACKYLCLKKYWLTKNLKLKSILTIMILHNLCEWLHF